MQLNNTENGNAPALLTSFRTRLRTESNLGSVVFMVAKLIKFTGVCLHVSSQRLPSHAVGR